MITFTYPNGYTSEYDETIKVGDLITCYNEGYHRVTQIEDRPGKPPCYHYIKVCKFDGSYSKKLKGHCDASYCRHAGSHIKQSVSNHFDTIKALQTLLLDNKL